METHPAPAGAVAAGPRRATGHPSLAAAAAAAPTLVAVALLLVAAWFDGAFALRSWAPLAAFLTAALAAGGRWQARGWTLAAVAGLWALGVWALTSAAWSESPAGALEGGSRVVLYAALVALPVFTLPSRAWAIRAGALLTAGAAIITLATFVATVRDGADLFLAGRLDGPVGYRNGTAALFALAFWPLLAVAARRSGHPAMRAAAFATGVLALGLAFLTQSRGVVLGFGCGAVVALALGPDRLRRAWLAIVAVIIVAAASSRLLIPYDHFLDTGRTAAAAVRPAARALAAMGAVAFAGGLLVAVFDGGLRLARDHDGIVRRIAAAALAAVVVLAMVASLVVASNPVSLASKKLDEFKQLEPAATGQTRLGSTGGQRYDLWRIAVDEWRAAPVLGVGQAGYAAGYYADRRTDRNLPDPHSEPLRVLAETGAVGLLLLIGALVAAAVALVRGWRGAGPDERRWASALAAAAAVVIGQSAIDWLWLIPGLTGIGFAALGIALAVVTLPRERPGEDTRRAATAPRERLSPRRRATDPANGPSPRRRALGLAARALPLAATVLVALLFVSDLYTRSARATTVPGQRLAAARTAARLNPLALPPLYLQAGALEALGRRDEARGRLLAALDREPRSFVALGLLGDLETRAGHRAAAKAYYRRALALNPRDTGLQQLAR